MVRGNHNLLFIISRNAPDPAGQLTSPPVKSPMATMSEELCPAPVLEFGIYASGFVVCGLNICGLKVCGLGFVACGLKICGLGFSGVGRGV